MNQDQLKVSKDTQKFVMDLADLPSDKYNRILNVLEALEKQQQAEAHLENKKGWRYMWQRTPKPFLLMLGYLVFLAPVGSFGYQAFSHVPDSKEMIYLIILSIILILPLLVVFHLSYHYIHQKSQEEVKDEKERVLQQSKQG